MPTLATEIRLPLTITADGSKAVASLQKFRGQANSIESKISSYFKAEASGLGGMLASYFGINAALDGMKQLYEFSKKVSDIAGTYSAPVSRAQGGIAGAQVQSDIRTGKSVEMTEMERAALAIEDLNKKSSTLAMFASAFGLQIEQLWSLIKNDFSIAINILTGDWSAALENLRTIYKRVSEAFSLFLPDWLEDWLQKGGVLGEKSDSQYGSVALGGLSENDRIALETNDPMKAETTEVLRQIARNTRGQR